MHLDLFLLKSDRGYYKKRNKWVADPQQASVWTSRQGASAAKGCCDLSLRPSLTIVPVVGMLATQ